MDSREWFLEHKNIYLEHVLKPMQEVVSALTPLMLEIDPAFRTEPAVGKTISHINRSTRFTKDKSLYRSNIWCTFARDKRLSENLPGFFFEVSPNGCSFGCGYYKASNKSLEIMREMILADDPLWLALRESSGRLSPFCQYGEKYRKDHYPEQPAEKREWLNLRNIGFETQLHDPDILYSGRITGVLLEEFPKLEPLYHFMMQAEEHRIGEEQAHRHAARGIRPDFDW